MQNDPRAEWQRLTETYSNMYDEELLELRADSENLTEQARQVLGDELRKRGLDVSRNAERLPNSRLGWAAGAPVADPGVAELLSDISETDESLEPQPEFTWKTPLCECGGQEEAWQIREVLRRAGIESWVEAPGGSFSPYSGLDQSAPRILVPADRLEEARALATRPIPKEIVEQSQLQTPEFELPVCPKCGAGDPVLEDVDPSNRWLCEACGSQWTEAGEDEAGGPDEAKF